MTIAFGIDMPFAGTFLLQALLVIGVAVPTPGAVGSYHEAYRIGVTTFFGAPNDAAVAAAIVVACRVVHAGRPRRHRLHGAGRPQLRRPAGDGGSRAEKEMPDSHEVPVLRPSRRQGRRLAREQGRRSDSPAARMPRLRPPLHQLRADRRDPVHGDQEGRHARAVRAAEAHCRPAEGVREAPRERRCGRGGGGHASRRRCRSAPRRK